MFETSSKERWSFLQDKNIDWKNAKGTAFSESCLSVYTFRYSKYNWTPFEQAALVDPPFIRGFQSDIPSRLNYSEIL